MPLTDRSIPFLAMLVKLVVKVGEAGKASRTTIKCADDEIEVDLSGSFETLCAVVDTHVSLVESSYQPQTVREDRGVYVKPHRYASQRDLQLLDVQNFQQRHASPAHVWRIHHPILTLNWVSLSNTMNHTTYT
jgi:hypothetical protein